MLVTAIAILCILLISFWVFGFTQANDLSIAPLNIYSLNGKKVLVVFPHADDEALSMAGFLSLATKRNITVDWLLLTRGERGNNDAHLDDVLKKTRTEEAQKTASIYKVDKLIQLDYPDNGVSEEKEKLEKDIREYIKQSSPDIIISYDLSGMYGHPDHIIASEIVTELVKNEFQNVSLWYIAETKKVLAKIQLPEHMAKDNEFKKRRVEPNLRIWVGLSGVYNKIKATYTYKSQLKSFSEGYPIKWLPLWFYISITPYEYFHEVK